MIKATHHKVIYPLFKGITRFLIWRNFSKVEMFGECDTEADDSLFVVANHVSWWDGFWVMYLNLKRIHRKYYVMMLEEQLRRHWYFKYTGAYSIKIKSRSMLKSLYYTLDLLSKKGTMVLWFPQGKIHSMHQESMRFKPGVDHVVTKSSSDFNVLFVANFVDYFSVSKPVLTIYYQSYRLNELGAGIEVDYQDFYDQCLAFQKSRVS